MTQPNAEPVKHLRQRQLPWTLKAALLPVLQFQSRSAQTHQCNLGRGAQILTESVRPWLAPESVSPETHQRDLISDDLLIKYDFEHLFDKHSLTDFKGT